MELEQNNIMLVLFLSWISAFHLCTVNAQAGTLLEYSIYEQLPRGTEIGNVVNDAELGEKYSPSQIQELRFSFLDQPDSERPLLSISDRNGVLRTLDEIDRDVLCPQQSEVRCSPRCSHWTSTVFPGDQSPGEYSGHQ